MFHKTILTISELVRNNSTIAPKGCKQSKIAPLITFRILFGALMCFGIIRFWWNGWIEKLYIEPTFFFKFYGFEWISYVGDEWIYYVFLVAGVSALGVMLGFFYRISILLFFISFTYIELLDATNYLNHYYLVCLLAFLLIFLPAHRAISLDTYFNKDLKLSHVPKWTIDILKFQIAVVYIFAGLAKLNYDWMCEAMPLAIWLPQHSDFPLIGAWFTEPWVAYLFSWTGAFYDCTIIFFLLYHRTRKWAYLAVLAFHGMTWMLFNIGLFPWIMVFNTLIFFSGEAHNRIWRIPTPCRDATLASQSVVKKPASQSIIVKPASQYIVTSFLTIYIILQIALPLRHYLYEGNVLENKKGYRFSWRVMLIEEVGQCTFWVEDKESNRKGQVTISDYLTPFQEKMMCVRPDFVKQFETYIKQEYQTKYNIKKPIVTTDCYVSLNGRASVLIVD